MTLLDAVERKRTSGMISSGSTGIDDLLGGGYPISEIIEIYGESKTGKTQLALQASLSAASRGYGVLYVDTEGTFRPERIESMAQARGLDSVDLLSRIFCARAPDTAAQRRSLRLISERKDLRNCRMVVVDTLTKNFALEYPGKSNAPRRQGLLDVYLSSLGRDAFLNNRAVLLTNRVTVARTEGVSREVHVGGNTVEQMVNHAIHLTRSGGSVRAALVAGRAEVKFVKALIGARGFN
jgi:DNA repair protein RadA